jgi:hypothetical protein
MAIPLAPFGEALLVFTRREDGGCAMEAHLLNNTADLLLRYCVTATLAAGVTVQSRLLDAESLLSEKDADPVAAAVAAGAILSYGELQWLHDWTERLDLRFSWLPDGAAIHAEHLARRGRHVEAAARFFEVPMRGLPVLGDALVFTIERLKWYSSLNPQHAQGIDVNRAADALAKLNPFGLAAHRGRPVTSYSGLDPRQPSQDLWDGLQMPADSVDLAEWLGEGGTRNVRGGGGALSNAPTIYAPPAIVSSR